MIGIARIVAVLKYKYQSPRRKIEAMGKRILPPWILWMALAMGMIFGVVNWIKNVRVQPATIEEKVLKEEMGRHS